MRGGRGHFVHSKLLLLRVALDRAVWPIAKARRLPGPLGLLGARSAMRCVPVDLARVGVKSDGWLRQAAGFPDAEGRLRCCWSPALGLLAPV